MADAEVQIAILQTKVEALTTQVSELSAAVKELTAIMNRGKGAFAASLALAGAIGAGVMKLVMYLFSLGQSGR
jgi:hypothetical protein